ncbi:MAG: FAD-dependent oxidoreductase, partial [Oscillospiraceae bacterium]|nr:FAD-dependent oxidoreductase [Oscillospiraceae bacterium]
MKQLYPLTFSPITIRGVEFKNRLVMTPSSPGLADHNGFMTVDYVNFFRPIAKGGVSTITIGNALIDWDEAHDEERQIRLDVDDTINPLTKFTDMCRQFGCEPSMELNHTGCDATYEYIKRPMVSASPCVSDFELVRAAAAGRQPVWAEEMSTEHVKQTVQKYVQAAVRCQQAGFKRVLVHGGHANLIGQFSSPYFNKRKDEYGGSLENRARFAIEVLDGIRKACGENFVIDFRVSADEMIEGGMHFDETKEYLLMLADKIDIVNVSAGIRGKFDLMHYWMSSYADPQMANVAYAGEVRKLLPDSVKVSAVAGIKNIDNAERILSEGLADIICMTRPFYADPEMPRKYALGKRDGVRPCLRCAFCSSRLVVHSSTQCAVNPLLGRQSEFTLGKLPKAEESRRIAVVGGGPAGLEAANTLLERGHKVTLYEAGNRLGGTLNHACGIQPLKQDLKAYLDYIVRRAENSALNIRLNTLATPELLDAENYDGLIIACGATPAFPPVPGIDLPHVHWAPEADEGKVEPGKHTVIIGAGSIGWECAYGLVKKGCVPTLVGMEPNINA